jgi:two-component sensor histidine kinase
VRIDGPQVLLEPNTAQAVAVTLHELATNAVKYGAFSTANGRIDLKRSHEANGRLILRWTETGGPTVSRLACRGARLRNHTSGVKRQSQGQLVSPHDVRFWPELTCRDVLRYSVFDRLR